MLLTRYLGEGGWWFLFAIAVIGIAVPYCNLAFQPGDPFYVSGFMVSLIGKFLTYALLAIAIDLIWGYCGILSLGHGAFFALGGYAMGMYLTRQIGDRGVYAHPVLPDFMVFSNWTELPWYWWGFDNFAFAMLMVLLVPGTLAFVFGWLAFRSRVTGVYFSIISQAMTFALMLAFFRNDMGFGGNNGLTDFKDILGFPIQARETRAGLFVASAMALMLGFMIAKAVTGSKLGQVLVAIRDAESRTRFLGYRVEHYKLFVFTLSAMMAGVAGASTCRRSGSSTPASSPPPTRSRWSSGSPWAAAGRWSGPSSVRSRSIMARPGSPRPFPSSGCLPWVPCSSPSPSSFPRVSSVRGTATWGGCARKSRIPWPTSPGTR